MGNQSQLFGVADRQQGFFTAKQAEEGGYKRSNRGFIILGDIQYKIEQTCALDVKEPK